MMRLMYQPIYRNGDHMQVPMHQSPYRNGEHMMCIIWQPLYMDGEHLGISFRSLYIMVMRI